MIERTANRFGLKRDRLAADSAYGSASSLNWMVEEQGIAPHIPLFDRSQRSDGTFSRDDFRFDRPPMSTFVLLAPGALVNDGATLLYRGSTFDCSLCEYKNQCAPGRLLARIREAL
jgi:hypothetical protein